MHGITRLTQRLSANCALCATSAVRTVTTGIPPSSFNPEAYMRYPQFLHDINNKLTLVKSEDDSQNLLDKGRLVYTQKCVTVEKGALTTLEAMNGDDKYDLKQLSVACKGLFWQSDIDYTCVPCLFNMDGNFSADKFLSELGLYSPQFKASLKFAFFSRGTLHKLPIISYQGEDAMNVYYSPLDTISSILGKYDEVYHITVGEGIINPSLEFIVAKTDTNKLIGFMSASVVE